MKFFFSIFEWLGRSIITYPVKILVILTTATLLGFGVFGITLLKMEFRPEWMLDPETECEFKTNQNIIIMLGFKG